MVLPQKILIPTFILTTPCMVEIRLILHAHCNSSEGASPRAKGNKKNEEAEVLTLFAWPYLKTKYKILGQHDKQATTRQGRAKTPLRWPWLAS